MYVINFRNYFTFLFRILFNFPSRYYSLSVFYLYLALPDGSGRFQQDYTCLAVLRIHYTLKTFLLYVAITLCGSTFQMIRINVLKHVSVLQPHNCKNNYGLGSSQFVRHYYGNHYYFLFLRVLRCFSSPGMLKLKRAGCPIQKSLDRRLFAPPQSLSQLITSFIAHRSQVIH